MWMDEHLPDVAGMGASFQGIARHAGKSLGEPLDRIGPVRLDTDGVGVIRDHLRDNAVALVTVVEHLLCVLMCGYPGLQSRHLLPQRPDLVQELSFCFGFVYHLIPPDRRAPQESQVGEKYSWATRGRSSYRCLHGPLLLFRRSANR